MHLRKGQQTLTVNRLRAPALSTMDLAAAKALGYAPAWTLRMQTARGTFTMPLPTAAPAPATNAIPPAQSMA